MKQLDLGKGTVCLVFFGEGKHVAVMWRSMGAPAIPISLPPALRLRDIMGNVIAASAGASPMLSAFPIYVRGDGTLDAFTAALQAR